MDGAVPTHTERRTGGGAPGAASLINRSRLVGAGLAACVVVVGLLALSRHGQAVALKDQANTAARQGDYSAAITYLAGAQAAWPLVSQQAAVKRDRALLASNEYFNQGSRAFSSKNWADAVREFQGVMAGNVHYHVAQTLLATAEQRRTQKAAVAAFVQDWTTLENQVNVLDGEYNTDVNYLNGAWQLFGNGLTPNTQSLVNANKFAPTIQNQFAKVEAASVAAGTAVGTLKADGLSAPALIACYTSLTAAMSAMQDQATALSDELDSLNGNANGTSDYYASINSDIGSENADITAEDHDMSVAGNDESEFLGTAVAVVGPVAEASGAQSGA